MNRGYKTGFVRNNINIQYTVYGIHKYTVYGIKRELFIILPKFHDSEILEKLILLSEGDY